MRRILAFLAILPALGALTAPGAAQGAPVWRPVSGVEVGVDSAHVVLTYNRNLTVLFEHFRVDLQQRTDSLAMVRVHAFQVGIDSLAEPAVLRFSQGVLGFLHKDGDSRVVVVANLGVQLMVREFPFGESFEGDFIVFGESRPRWTPGERYFGSVAVFVQRRRPDVIVLVDIDSFDATVDPDSALTKRR